MNERNINAKTIGIIVNNNNYEDIRDSINSIIKLENCDIHKKLVDHEPRRYRCSIF